jgi:hypothetical protein
VFFSNILLGGVPEWPKGTDCKSAGSAFGGSNPPPSTRLFYFAKRDIASGNSSIGRASAFQAEGREFEPRFPLHLFYLVLQMGAHVAQLVERILGKDEVTGSIPVVGSILTLVETLEIILTRPEETRKCRRKSLRGQSRTST